MPLIHELLSVWEKLIHANRKSSIVCLSSYGYNNTVPDPTLSFLEQCTINIVVATDSDPYNHIIDNLHRMRSSLHSTFIIVSNFGCYYRSFVETVHAHFKIFYKFAACNPSNASIFPNAFVNLFYQSEDKNRLTMIKSDEPFSVFDDEVPESYYDNVYPRYVYFFTSGDVVGVEIYKSV